GGGGVRVRRRRRRDRPRGPCRPAARCERPRPAAAPPRGSLRSTTADRSRPRAARPPPARGRYGGEALRRGHARPRLSGAVLGGKPQEAVTRSIMPDFSPVDYAIPAFVLLVLAEMLWAWKRRPEAYEPKDTLTSLAFGLGSTVAGVLFGGFALLVFLAAYEYRLFDIGWAWWAWIACFVLDDLAYYWVHRAGHRVRWFWASHVNHHSSQHYNLSTALRQSWTGAFTLGF